MHRHCPDKYEPVRQLLLDGRPEWSPRSLWIETDQQLIDTVSRFPGAIGFVSCVFAQPLMASGHLKALNIDGVPPERIAVEAGHYRLKGPLILVYRAWNEITMGPFFGLVRKIRGSPLGQAELQVHDIERFQPHDKF